MTKLFIAAATALMLVSAVAHAQHTAPGGPIGNSTGIGSGLGRQGTGPGYSNGTNLQPQPLTHSVPSGGYGYRPSTLAPPAGLSSPSLGHP
jgi:hypothetical protein